MNKKYTFKKNYKNTTKSKNQDSISRILKYQWYGANRITIKLITNQIASMPFLINMYRM